MKIALSMNAYKTVITGATRGMGRAIALKLASLGHELAVSARSQQELDKLKTEISQLSGNTRVHTFACDLSQREDVKAFADFILSKWEKTDVLINNAGTYVEGGIADTDEEIFMKMMNLNFYAAFYLTKALLPGMQKAKSGHIFNICSIASTQHVKGASYYSISKHALYAFSKSLREEIRKDIIKVTSILPGSTFTSSWDDESIRPQLVQAEDIASSIAYALSLSPSAAVEDIIIKPIQFRS